VQYFFLNLSNIEQQPLLRRRTVKSEMEKVSHV
jgi:hypothetical protein